MKRMDGHTARTMLSLADRTGCNVYYSDHRGADIIMLRVQSASVKKGGTSINLLTNGETLHCIDLERLRIM